MKNYNKILEAVNRGIQLALDDFDDEEQVLNVKSKQVLNRDYTKEYLDLLRDEVVDLGLPSGTLWCKYNLDVDPTKLSKVEDWYGGYYAWGELKSKNESKYNWHNYKFGKSFNELTKYCNNPEFGLNGFTDNLTLLLSEDDVAYQNKKFYNFKFHIPTKELFEELLKYTNSYCVNNYDPNKLVHNPENDRGIKGLNGRVFEGKNANLMFIPAAGKQIVNQDGTDCYLWTSSLNLDLPRLVYYLTFYSHDIIGIYSTDRYDGFTIRPVINL